MEVGFPVFFRDINFLLTLAEGDKWAITPQLVSLFLDG
jgi:hypothetical protein